MKKLSKKIYVTQPSLPDLNEFTTYLNSIWESRQLTNNAKFHNQLEKELSDFLGVKHVSLLTSGTQALLTALKVLNISGDVITTPYSFVATTNVLLWSNINPIFVDVDPVYGNLDPLCIEKSITSKTSAILPVHVYGNPCEVEAINKIANEHQLKVIYDAAHAFGINYKNNSILNWGDLSILSFHATKPFNTMEGGAIISHDRETKQKIDYFKNFGFQGETKVLEYGINSKMNEMQSALGLSQLKHYTKFILKRKNIAAKYDKALQNIPGVRTLANPKEVDNYNHSYYPIFIDKEKYGISRDQLYKKFKEFNIYTRRYFYPLITDFHIYKKLSYSKSNNFPKAKQLSEQILCLPMYPDLEEKYIDKIIKII